MNTKENASAESYGMEKYKGWPAVHWYGRTGRRQKDLMSHRRE